ncbi:PAS domain S-box protein [Anabaena sp. UHCC 0399]|uniref:PAS domain S-box protein n=1 Tax=Anabaena sp. UHCC 0399 TaxID=3110238 RepID=UPI002B1F93CE|nr:PAS domain S-box protein [Anabaena sp. UHCC 0399]MEA5565860.1 PAS domain S-box protein [Anabaena sp. UHCC 0399]
MDTQLFGLANHDQANNSDVLLTDAIIRQPLVVTPNTPAIEALILMNNTRTSGSLSHDLDQSWLKTTAKATCVLVMQDKQLVGIWTEQDLVRLSAEGLNMAEKSMAEVMSHPVITLQESELNNFSVPLQLFSQHRLRHLPVVDHCHQVIGLLTYETLLNGLSKLQQLQTQQKQDCQGCIGVQMEASEKKYRSLAENMPDGIYLVSPDRELLYLNPAIAQIFGRPCAYFFTNYPDSVFNCIHPDDRELFISAFFPERGEQKNNEINYRIIKPDGSIRYVCDRAHIIYDAEGKVEAYQGIVTDITAAKQVEQALRDSEHRYATLTANAPVGIFCTDLQGNCQYLNPKWEEMAGLPMAEALGLNWSQALHPEDRDLVVSQWSDAVAKQLPFFTEHRFQNSKNKVIWVMAQAIPEIDSTGNCTGYIGTVTDISDVYDELCLRKRMEGRLEMQNRILSQIAKGEPLADILHALITSLEQQLDSALCCILSVDQENRMHQCASVNLPKEYFVSCDGVMIGEGVGSCGTAAYRQQVIIVSDIANDPLWQDYKDFTLNFGLRACWSAPIIASDGCILGTFGIYYREVKTPQTYELETLTLAAYLAGIAMERQRAVIALEKSESFLRAIYEDVEQAIFTVEIDPQGEYCYGAWNPVAERFFGISGIETQGKNPKELFGESLGTLLCQQYDACFESGNIVSFEEHFTNSHTNRSYWLLITLKPLQNETGRIYCLIGTAADITGRKGAEESLKTLVEGTAAVTGTEFFSALARYTAKALDVPYVLVTERIGNCLKTLGFFANNKLQSQITYNIAQTPCEKALVEGIFYCESKVAQEFPADVDLTIMEAEYYLGVALRDNNGVAIGNLCVLDTHPLEEPERMKATLRVFASRASAELERKRATEALEQLNEELEVNITQRTAALQESEARFRVTFEQANVGIFEVDLQGRFMGMNQKFGDIVGYSETELLGKSFMEITYPEDITADCLQMDYLLASELQTFAMEKRYIHKQGRLVWVYLTVAFVRSLAGEPQYMIGAIQDISDRKRAEELLQKQAQREKLLRNITQHIRQSLDLKSILSSAVNEIRQTFQADRVLIFHLMSNGMGVVLQQSVAPEYPIIESILWENECFPPECYEFYLAGNVRIVTDTQNDDWADFLAKFMQQTQVKSQIIAPIIQKVENQPARVWGLISIHACATQRQWQPDEANLLQQIASQLSVAIQQADLYQQVQTELSDRKRAEVALSMLNEELLSVNTELSRATRLKDEFLASMSHELRTPLNAILGMSEGLLEGVFGQITERQQHALSTIERSGKHLLELINDILDLAKIAAGKLELQIAPITICYLCESSLAFVKQLAHQKQIQIRLNIQSTIKRITVDERRMRQVLINLLNNAVKFTPEGGVIILAVRRERMENYPTPGNTHSPQSQSLEWVSFSVIDTGIGIAPKDMEKLFQSFVQIDSRLNRQYTGSGLGLALVRQIAELHGGQVTVSSEVGKGSCFTVRLPYIDKKLTFPTPPADVQLPLTSLSTIPSLVSESPLILLAEDNQANIETISSYLESRGYRLILATNGQTAINLAKSQNPSLILMDIQMPQINGLEAIRSIRENEELANVPIIALTALAMPGDREKCLQAGANDYVNKPVKLRELTSRIQNLLEK